MSATSTFHALLSRMKYIRRWSLMRCTRTETLGEHTAEVAQIAYTLCCAGNALFEGGVRPDAVAAAALFHDAAEIITGDLPTPVKYRNPGIKGAYQALEQDACNTLLATLPAALRPTLAKAVTAAELSDKERQLLKAADRISAVIKCIEERQSGNREFDSAHAQQLAALAAMHCPEADWFIETMLPAYSQTLDEVTGSL